MQRSTRRLVTRRPDATPDTPPAEMLTSHTPSAAVVSRQAGNGAIRQYGLFALTLVLVAASKWGSYIVPGPPYITDIVLAILILERLLRLTPRSRALGVDPWLGVFSIALVVWSLIALAFGSISQNALRDAAPYLYAVSVFLVSDPRGSNHRLAGRAITVALVLHAGWVTAAEIAPGLPDAAPLLAGSIHLFEVRSDIDGMLCGLLAALGLHRALEGRNPGRNLLLAGWGTALVGVMHSRAALLAFVVQLAIVFALGHARRRAAGSRDTRPIAAVLVVCIPLVVFAASQSTSVSRLAAGFGGTAAYTTGRTSVGGASGTQAARTKAWNAVARYLEADPGRTALGVGFGPDFLHDSGADVLLLGSPTDEVRAPHDYWVNTWARVGLVGLLAMVGILVAAMRLGVLVSRHAPRMTDTDLLALFLAVGVPVIASFGVVLESPFGAVPWFWALGHLSARACGLGVVAPLSQGRNGPRASGALPQDVGRPVPSPVGTGQPSPSDRRSP